MADSNINNASSCLNPISTDQSSTTTDHQLAAAAEDDHATDQSSTSATDHQVAADVATAIAITNTADGDGNQADGNGNNRSSAAAATGDDDDDDKAQISEIRKTMKSHTIVAALIATVTFAAAFTLPGGYVQSGSDYYQGMAVLSLHPPPKNITNSTEVVVGTFDAMMMRNRFLVFVWVDSIAMVLSLSAIVVYFLAAFPIKSKKPLRAALFYGYFLTMLAMIAMVFAFIFGLLAVLPDSGYEALLFVIFPGFFLLGFGPASFILNMNRPTW